MTNVYDHEGTMRRMGGDAELFLEMVELLRTDAPKHLSLARRSLRDGDWTSLGRAAHTLKGLAANFGATRAVTTAAELERQAKSGDVGDLERILGDLGLAIEELVTVLPRELLSGQR